MLQGIWHTGLHVSDIERSIVFYRDLLGLRLVHRQESHTPYIAQLVGYDDAHLLVAQLALPDRSPSAASSHDIELVQYLSPRGSASPAQRCDPGTAHLAFAVDDIAATYTRLRENGVRFVGAPARITAGVNLGGAACYFLDPDDHTLEFVQPPLLSSGREAS